jgi:hypothetical protein
VAALVVALGGCGAEEPAPEAAPDPGVPEAGPPLQITPLTDEELLGVDRSRITLTMPWSEQAVSRSPAPASARGMLRALDVHDGGTFDRVTFTFGTDAPFPGYRVVWSDSTNAMCGEGMAIALPPEDPTLLIAFEPATGHEDGGRRTIAERSRSTELPVLRRAREVCDQADRLTWAITAADSARFRVVELRDPPRLLVDVMHP